MLICMLWLFNPRGRAPFIHGTGSCMLLSSQYISSVFIKMSDDQILLFDSCKQLIFSIVLARSIINKGARLMGPYIMTVDE
jgi:hypothetical protein